MRVSKRQRERIVRLAEEVAEKAAKNLTRAGRAALKATGTAVVMRD